MRLDAAQFLLPVQVDHAPWPAVAHMPFSDQILVPGAELLRVRGTRRGALAPKIGISNAKNRIAHARDCRPQMLFRDVPAPDILQVDISVFAPAATHAFQP